MGKLQKLLSASLLTRWVSWPPLPTQSGFCFLEFFPRPILVFSCSGIPLHFDVSLFFFQTASVHAIIGSVKVDTLPQITTDSMQFELPNCVVGDFLRLHDRDKVATGSFDKTAKVINVKEAYLLLFTCLLCLGRIGQWHGMVDLVLFLWWKKKEVNRNTTLDKKKERERAIKNQNLVILRNQAAWFSGGTASERDLWLPQFPASLHHREIRLQILQYRGSGTRFVRTRLSTYTRLLRSLRRSRTSPIGHLCPFFVLDKTYFV